MSMIHSNNNSAPLTVLHMATDLRIQLQRLQVQVDEALEYEQCQPDHCLAQKLISLISSTTLSQTLALELVHRLSQGSSQSSGCLQGCEVHCPWFQASQRVERWLKSPDFEPEAYRLALYDFQRGVMMSVNLADYFEANLQQVDDDGLTETALLQTAFCLSSWLRKLVQLLDQVGPKVSCRNGARREHCV